MLRAIELAERGRGHVEPNPMVGCVLVKDGKLIGEGYHRRFGGPHAEVDALQSLTDRSLADGATAFVTLEPCCHTGKTPPCTAALINAGITRVVAAIADPFPQVNGGGLAQLRHAGIETEVGICQREATKLSAPYLKRVRSNRPWVIAKWAMTLDGRIATISGDSQWISGEVSRGEVHRLRGLVDAIIIGGGTAAIDDPTLTARPPGPRLATRIVVANNRLPAIESRLVQTIDQAPLMVVVPHQVYEESVEPLANAGAEIFRCATSDSLAMITELLDELGKRQMTNVMVEGGGSLLGSFLSAGQIDEVHAYIGSRIVGGAEAPGPVGGNGFRLLGDTPDFEIDLVQRFDSDVYIVARKRDSRC
ncbi:MAG TPA: bifunctional diaminohydroxyphosphoribosylaminopyrimidine deaminase/5-amino-6-(5-phosphoribosylamino)uracil reductase RibD [Planctomycetaceae bacterium]|nr:bifunctional diaminohydroxyphosphoribosylaminopyrimidine deaminase/5-amino-6-(5-phosphoribosylamino)uracil reductase RibD [Planctomycetaceae bacterium]